MPERSSRSAQRSVSQLLCRRFLDAFQKSRMRNKEDLRNFGLGGVSEDFGRQAAEFGGSQKKLDFGGGIMERLGLEQRTRETGHH